MSDASWRGHTFCCCGECRNTDARIFTGVSHALSGNIELSCFLCVLFSLQYQAKRLTWLSPSSVLHGFCFVEPPSRHDGVVFRCDPCSMGNHSSSVFRRSTHIKVHVRCGLMPSPRTRNVGYTFRHSRSRSDGAGRLHWSSNPNGNIARFVVARMCTSSCTFPSSQRASCTHKPAVQQRTCNRERSCACDV